MRFSNTFLIGALAAMLLQGCSPGLPKVGPAMVAATSQGTSANDSTRAATREGEACNYNILGLVAFGDASIDRAKRDGNIGHVVTVEREIFSINPAPVIILPIIFAYTCTTVRGLE
jgi:hypothetical protein